MTQDMNIADIKREITIDTIVSIIKGQSEDPNYRSEMITEIANKLGVSINKNPFDNPTTKTEFIDTVIDSINDIDIYDLFDDVSFELKGNEIVLADCNINRQEIENILDTELEYFCK
jgi:hypothetical protein